MLRKAVGKNGDLRPSTSACKSSPLLLEFKNPHPSHDLEIVVLAPMSPAIGKQFINSSIYLAQRAAAPFRLCRMVFDPTGTPPPPNRPHPFRQAALAEIRQNMVDKYLGEASWVFWVDVDIVDYPASLFVDLISRVKKGIAAPILLMDGELGTGPAYRDGFGWGKFYDVAGFVEGNRWARFEEPWFDQPGPEYSLDCVGGCYAVSGEIYRGGARHLPDAYSLELVSKGITKWNRETVAANQKGPANCFTEHYSVCQWAKQRGYPVRAFSDLVARHAKV